MAFGRAALALVAGLGFSATRADEPSAPAAASSPAVPVVVEPDEERRCYGRPINYLR
jgi:hypothetical protein